MGKSKSLIPPDDGRALRVFLKTDARTMVRDLLYEEDVHLTTDDEVDTAVNQAIEEIITVVGRYHDRWETLGYKRWVGLEHFKAISAACDTIIDGLAEIPSEYLGPYLPFGWKLTCPPPEDISDDDPQVINDPEMIITLSTMSLKRTVDGYIASNASGGGEGGVSHHAREMTLYEVLDTIRKHSKRSFWSLHDRADTLFVFELARFCHRLCEAVGMNVSPLVPKGWDADDISEGFDLPPPTLFVRNIRELGQKLWAATNPPRMTRGVSRKAP